MNDLLRIYSPRRRTALLAIAAALIVAIAVVDIVTKPYLSLQSLYLFPIIIVGGFLRRSHIVAVALMCAVMGEAFGELPANEMLLRLLFSSAGLTATGLFISELIRNREVALKHAAELEEQQTRLRDAEEELQFLVDTSPAAIITIDAEGRVLLANEAAHRLLGFESEPLRGQSIAAYVPLLHSIIASHSSRVLRTTLQCRGRRKTGEAFLVGVWFSTYRTAGSPRLAAIIVDLSEDLRNREDLSFEHLLRSTRILMSAIAHEIRNLCSAALVVYKNLSQMQPLEHSEDFRALGTLMQSLEAIMTIELQPSLSPRTATIELTTVFDELRVLLDAALGESQIEIDWRLPESLPLVRGERYGLIQVFLNLAKNSQRAMQATAMKRLQVSAAEDYQTLRIDFEDTGIGVASSDRLFHPFQPGATSTGLGLYVSRAIVRSFGGDLVYEPRSHGACFTVILAIASVGAAVNA
jgi:two-component system, LuxR family, sensor kinase FixL